MPEFRPAERDKWRVAVRRRKVEAVPCSESAPPSER
jgi:hypothetical protein